MRALDRYTYISCDSLNIYANTIDSGLLEITVRRSIATFTSPTTQ
jgi:hypothetical protein